MRDFQVYLEDILASINNIEDYTRSLDCEAFVEDKKTVDAVIRNLEIIGEATKRVPEKIRKKYPKIPWKDMAGMRDKLIHGYSGVNLSVVWKTIEERLPAVKLFVKEALADVQENKNNKP